MAKHPAPDTQWPPLGVRDLKPDMPARRERVLLNTLADALERAAKRKKNNHG